MTYANGIMTNPSQGYRGQSLTVVVLAVAPT